MALVHPYSAAYKHNRRSKVTQSSKKQYRINTNHINTNHPQQHRVELLPPRKWNLPGNRPNHWRWVEGGVNHSVAFIQLQKMKAFQCSPARDANTPFCISFKSTLPQTCYASEYIEGKRQQTWKCSYAISSKPKTIINKLFIGNPPNIRKIEAQ